MTGDVDFAHKDRRGKLMVIGGEHMEAHVTVRLFLLFTAPFNQSHNRGCNFANRRPNVISRTFSNGYMFNVLKSMLK